jgi:hypothetical protein
MRRWRRSERLATTERTTRMRRRDEKIPKMAQHSLCVVRAAKVQEDGGGVARVVMDECVVVG